VHHLGLPVAVPAALFDVEADVLVPGARTGAVDEARARTLGAAAVVPAANVPYTRAGLDVLRARGIAAHADFVCNTGGVLGYVSPATATPAEVLAGVEARIGDLVRTAADHPGGPFAGACEMAERFLATWVEPDAFPSGPPWPEPQIASVIEQFDAIIIGHGDPKPACREDRRRRGLRPRRGRTIARLAKLVEVAIAPLDLSLPQYRLLAHLVDGAAMSSTLAERLAVKPPTVTAVVDGPGHPGTGHAPGRSPTTGAACRSALTPEGTALVGQANALVGAALLDGLGLVADEDAGAAVAGLDAWQGRARRPPRAPCGRTAGRMTTVEHDPMAASPVRPAAAAVPLRAAPGDHPPEPGPVVVPAGPAHRGRAQVAAGILAGRHVPGADRPGGRAAGRDADDRRRPRGPDGAARAATSSC
jgi:hypothetical protein